MITYDFCKQFIKELHMIFNITTEDYAYDSNLGVSCGWVELFCNACRKLGKNDLFKK